MTGGQETGGGTAAAAPFSAAERQLLARVDDYLGRGLALERWWRAAGAGGSQAHRFELGRTYNDSGTSFGFFGHAPVGGARMAVMGNFQRMFYDQPKSPLADRKGVARWMRDQIREFVLHYFMRVSDFRLPEGYVATDRPPTPPWLRPLSWCPQEDVARRGFGFQQLYYKRRDSGEIRRFPEERKFAIVDLRDLGHTYEWIVVKVCIFDFTFSFKPFGAAAPYAVLPLQEDSYLVLSRDLIVDQEAPAPGVLGRYGLGYAFIKNPVPGFIAYGPGEFDAALELIEFEVGAAGRVEVSMSFVANRPERIANLPLDPMAWGWRLTDLMSLGMASHLLQPLREIADRLPMSGAVVDPVQSYIALANLLTGGIAGDDLCVTREQLERDFLVKHYMQHYQTLAGSLAVWRLIGDWLDEAALPRWVVEGRPG